tara:strand:- start:1835 stop:3022 length:1188 start_codon:yes stop_codon:yes gene_type:complete
MGNILNKISSCEVCSNKNLIDVLNLGNHPLCDELIEIGDPVICEEYPIQIVFCEKCNTAHQKYQVPNKILFSENYHYRTKATGVVLDGMKNLVNSSIKRYGSLLGVKVLDIGCNDGGLLDLFKLSGAKTYGIEPTNSAIEAMKSHKVIKDYFDKRNAELLRKNYGEFDIITFTNVFAHIEDLISLIRNLKLIMSDKTKLIIENHYLGSILQKKQFDTFYQEHPRSYSLKSFTEIAKKLNRNITGLEFPGRDGGNIRVFMSNHNALDNLEEDLDFIKLFEELNFNLLIWKNNKKSEIETLIKVYGPLPAKAFPGRATILIKLLGLTENHLSAVYEIKGSIKTGKYVPGTRIPILPEADLYKIKDQKPIINLAWHIPEAVRNNLSKNNYLAEVIDIK